MNGFRFLQSWITYGIKNIKKKKTKNDRDTQCLVCWNISGFERLFNHWMVFKVVVVRVVVVISHYRKIYFSWTFNFISILFQHTKLSKNSIIKKLIKYSLVEKIMSTSASSFLRSASHLLSKYEEWEIWYPRGTRDENLQWNSHWLHTTNFFFFVSMLQILQLQMNDYRYHYMFTTFVSIQ